MRESWAVKKILMLFGLFVISTGVMANCESGHWLQTKNDDGTILTLEDGSVWRVTGGGEVDSQLWLDADELLVCDDGTMINKDEDNEQVDVELLSR